MRRCVTLLLGTVAGLLPREEPDQSVDLRVTAIIGVTPHSILLTQHSVVYTSLCIKFAKHDSYTLISVGRRAIATGTSTVLSKYSRNLFLRNNTLQRA